MFTDDFDPIRDILGEPIEPSDIPAFFGEMTENEIGTERRNSDDIHRIMLDLQNKLDDSQSDKRPS